MNNEPVAWNEEEFNHIAYSYRSWPSTDPIGVSERYDELVNYVQSITHPAKNNGGNPEELNTRQIQDARTSLESTPPFAYAVVSKECPDGMENMSLQFNEPVEAKKVIPLYERPIDVTDEEILEIWKEFDDKDADNWFIAIARAILRKASE